MSPGSVVSVFGQGLATVTTAATTLPLPTDLGGLTLVFDNETAAPEFFVSPGQANAFVPWELLGATSATLEARRGDLASNRLTVELVPVAPGVFTLDQSGDGPAAVLMGAAVPQTVRSGDIISLFATGFGDVTNRPPSGAVPPAPPLSEVLGEVAVAIGGVEARVLFAGLAPGFVGLYQINLEILGDLPNGEVDVVVTVDGVESNRATLLIG